MVAYWKTGMRITSGRLNRALPVEVRKLVTSSRTSDTALAADTELVLPLLANTSYLVKGTLLVSGGDGAGDFQYGWEWTNTMTVIMGGGGPVDSIASGTSGSAQFAYAAVDTSSPSASIGYAASATGMNVQISATVEVGASAGNLSLRWAQLSSNVTASNLLVGSVLTALPTRFS